MKKWGVLFLILVINISLGYAKEIKGVVLNGESIALQGVSIYLKSYPSFSYTTDANGEFAINLEGVKSLKEDIIIFSHIGYDTKEYKVEELSGDICNKIALVENSIILDDITVIARKKLSRKEQKKWKLSIIEKFKEQIKRDFTFEDRAYKVVSDVEVIRDSKRVLYNKLIGEYIELIGVLPDNKDSIALNYTDIENYIDRDIESGLEEMSDRFGKNNVVSKKRRENKRMLDSAFYKDILNDTLVAKEMVDAHKLFWSMNRDIRERIEEIDEIDTDDWEIVESGDNTILRYRYKRGVLGIVKIAMVTDFIVDPYSYSLERIVEKVSVELNIPFGYRLPPDALMLLNIINAKGNDMEKYRVRHLYVDANLNTIYKRIDESKYVDERSCDLDISVIDTKKRAVKAESKVLVKVLSIENNKN